MSISPLVYLGGSLRNRADILRVSLALRSHGFNVFNDWLSSGEHTDDKWRELEQAQGRTFAEALKGPYAKNVFEFDLFWLGQAAAFVLVLPAGKSAHMELVHMVKGERKPAYVLMEEEPERWDIMLQWATALCTSIEELVEHLKPILSGTPFVNGWEIWKRNL